MKTFTTIELDKTRQMRFGYSVMKKIDKQMKSGNRMEELEALEYMIFMSLTEDDPTLKLEDVEALLNDCDLEYVSEKLDETIRRDMPGLVKHFPGTSPNLMVLPKTVNPE